MVSDSTARLVDTVALLGETRAGSHQGRQRTRCLLAGCSGWRRSRRSDRAEPTFVGRQWEMGALNGVLERSINGNGSIVGRGRAAGNRQEPHRARAHRRGPRTPVPRCSQPIASRIPPSCRSMPPPSLLRSTSAEFERTGRRRRSKAGARALFRSRRRRPSSAGRSAGYRRSRCRRSRRSIPTPVDVDLPQWSRPPLSRGPLRRSTSSRTRIGSTSQRVDAGGVAHGGAPDAVVGRRHIPAGIRLARLLMRRGRRRLHSSRWMIRRCWRWAPIFWARTDRSPNLPSSSRSVRQGIRSSPRKSCGI